MLTIHEMCGKFWNNSIRSTYGSTLQMFHLTENCWVFLLCVRMREKILPMIYPSCHCTGLADKKLFVFFSRSEGSHFIFQAMHCSPCSHSKKIRIPISLCVLMFVFSLWNAMHWNSMLIVLIHSKTYIKYVPHSQNWIVSTKRTREKKNKRK